MHFRVDFGLIWGLGLICILGGWAAWGVGIELSDRVHGGVGNLMVECPPAWGVGNELSDRMAWGGCLLNKLEYRC